MMHITVFGKEDCSLCKAIKELFSNHIAGGRLNATIDVFEFPTSLVGTSVEQRGVLANIRGDMAFHDLYEAPAVLVRSAPEGTVIWQAGEIKSIKTIPTGKIIRASSGDEDSLNALAQG